jgi:hypothetical protein
MMMMLPMMPKTEFTLQTMHMPYSRRPTFDSCHVLEQYTTYLGNKADSGTTPGRQRSSKTVEANFGDRSRRCNAWPGDEHVYS